MPAADFPQYTLEPAEAEQLRLLAARARLRADDPGSAGFYDRNWDVVDELPAGLRRFLDRFRRTEAAGAALVHGLPVDEQAIGPTPDHWEAAAKDAARTSAEETALALCGLALGEPYTWVTLQSGRIVQNILPIVGDEWLQNGYGSKALLEIHTEDGFHPYRCDYLLLLGMRNPARVPTTVASVREIDLPARDRRILAEERFHILPDDEHIRQLEQRSPDHPALAEMIRMRDDPRLVAVLLGDPERPYVRIDRPYMRCAVGDPEAERALDRLVDELERVQRDVVIDQGTMLVLDNHLCVHGRKPFGARGDGTDRWLKKVTVLRDLRRAAADGRDGGVGSRRILI